MSNSPFTVIGSFVCQYASNITQNVMNWVFDEIFTN